MIKPFRWEDADARERADMIRGHRHLSEDQVCRLFHLSRHGLYAIYRGENWSPAYVEEPPHA